ncbi:hypothetical protein TTHERM_00773220 (macronuclear) [Tetrahymena thermophila SB210]|uniref:Uncharacterized protein n=1 Tax=Tetrahymena thermophila (strain SB210) TaxID=312017 RepID=I7LZG9_TETTS|nr:hypothetical protein TTHERM_00773220 [Tetrahymena thermophila SB210]EAR83912.3 hypothetical protein TTHERM_00773220 [Tetrahymena thermophila SB210]|eukprot:XP_001031575.3 hypothetical protein TTHERM_00773220 [Tetrahymena thermophila SB210]
MSNDQLFCFKKDCFWSKSKVDERLNYIKAQRELGIIVVDEKPLCLFYKSKTKLQRDQKIKCSEETLCQVHYFQKKISGEQCKECQKEHDYDKFQPEMVKTYLDKKREIQSLDNKNERSYDYLSSYLRYELQDSQQHKILQQIIQNEKNKTIDNKKKVIENKTNQDAFTLNKCYADNLPNVQIVSQDDKKDQSYAQVSGFDNKMSYDKGIIQLLKRYSNNK